LAFIVAHVIFLKTKMVATLLGGFKTPLDAEAKDTASRHGFLSSRKAGDGT